MKTLNGIVFNPTPQARPVLVTWQQPPLRDRVKPFAGLIATKLLLSPCCFDQW